MVRPIVKQSELNSMDINLESTGPQAIATTEIPAEYGKPVLLDIPHIDKIFGELIPGMTIAVGAHPGTGKTTFFLQVADILSSGTETQPAMRVCFISSEQDIGMIKKTADRINATGFDVMNETNVVEIEKRILNNEYDMVIVDSIHGLHMTGVSGTNKTAKIVTNKLHAAAKTSLTIVVMICHSTLAGKIKGGTLVTHTIDCEFYIHKHGVEHTRKLFTEKNRMGATGATYLNMTAKGFDLKNEIDPETGLPKGNSVKKNIYINHMVDRMNEHAALSEDDLYELCDEHNLCVDTAKSILQELVDQDKVIRDDDLWVVNI